MITVANLLAAQETQITVLHNDQGSSNKVYIPVRFQRVDQQWELGAFYGRVGSALQYTSKQVSKGLPSLSSLCDAKFNKGYVYIGDEQGFRAMSRLGLLRQNKIAAVQPSAYINSLSEIEYEYSSPLVGCGGVLPVQRDLKPYCSTTPVDRLIYGRWDRKHFWVGCDEKFARTEIQNPLPLEQSYTALFSFDGRFTMALLLELDGHEIGSDMSTQLMCLDAMRQYDVSVLEYSNTPVRDSLMLDENVQAGFCFFL